MGIVSLSEQAIAKNKAKNEDSQLTIKEVGYLLQLVESSKHDGQALELALICKMKLQGKLDILTKHRE